MKRVVVLIFFALFLVSCADMQVVIPGVVRPIFQDEFVLGQTGTWHLESDDSGSATIGRQVDWVGLRLTAPTDTQRWDRQLR